MPTPRRVKPPPPLLKGRLPIPDSIRFIHIYGVPYYLPWEGLLPGYSFFLKTTATATEVRKMLRTAERHFHIELKAHNRNEFGYYGVRVWRMN